MSSRACPHCARRLPFAGRRCIHCGWSLVVPGLREGAGVAWWRRTRVWVAAVVVFLSVASHFAYRNAPALADWYASFATRFLPVEASSFAPTDTEPGAFAYCARQVAKQMEGEYSVETFDQAGSRVETLGDRRYRIHAAVDEARETGERVRHDFSCTVRYDRGRWRLEELTLERFAGR